MNIAHVSSPFSQERRREKSHNQPKPAGIDYASINELYYISEQPIVHLLPYHPSKRGVPAASMPSCFCYGLVQLMLMRGVESDCNIHMRKIEEKSTRT